jgi:SAM-dependent methyltransferase
MSNGSFNPIYVSGRLIRKILPNWVSQRLLSRRFLPAERVYETTRLYLRALLEAGLIERFQDGAGLTVLEAGTGVYNPATAPFVMTGLARLLLLEPFPGGRIDFPRFRRRFDALLSLAREDDSYPLPKDWEGKGILASGKSPEGIPPGVELLNRHWESTGLSPESVDYLFSSSVLEHLREPEAVLKESRRILRKGGWMIHVVDLRDHFFRYPFEMLKYSERAWGFLTTASGGSGYQNRWRLTRWKEALERYGFATQGIVLLDLGERLAREKPAFAPEFRTLPDDDLRVGCAILVSQRMVGD